MSIPFRDHSPSDDLGVVAYLRIIEEDGGKGIRGALFFVNAQGEPAEFCFNRVDIPGSFLWRQGDARRRAVRELCKSLFAACTSRPAVILGRAHEIPALVFTEDIEVEVPICRVAEGEPTSFSTAEVHEVAETLNLYWVGGLPEADSPARNALDGLRARNLVLEPFERAERGIEEAFSQAQ